MSTPDSKFDYREASSENNAPEEAAPSDRGGFFKRIADTGRSAAKDLFGRATEKKISHQGRLGVCKNDFSMENCERKALKLKAEMESLDGEIKAKQILIGAMQKQIDLFRNKNYPLPGELELEMRIEKEKLRLLMNKKGYKQTDCEDLEIKASQFSKKKDSVANELMHRCKEKVMPLEQKLEVLKDYQEKIAGEMAKLESEHQKRSDGLNEIARIKAKAETDLMMRGKTKAEIENDKSIIRLEKLISDGFKQMQKEKRELNGKERQVESQIAEVLAKINKYKDRFGEFARYKENQPISLDLPERN